MSTTTEPYTRERLREDAAEVAQLLARAVELQEEAGVIAQRVAESAHGADLNFTFAQAIVDAAGGIHSDIAGEGLHRELPEVARDGRQLLELVERLTVDEG